MAVTLTESAAMRVADFLSRRGGEGLRFGVKTSGCSGLAYVVDFAEDVTENDRVFESHGVKVIIDKESLGYVDGTEIDFKKEGLNENFTFNNPNVTGACGCGESFSTSS